MIDASLRQRALAHLLDWVDEPIAAGCTAVWLLGFGRLGVAAGVAWCAWVVVQLRTQGRTGQTIGKRIVGIAVVDAHSSEPIGARRTALRWAARALDTIVPIRWVQQARGRDVVSFADQLVSSRCVRAN